MVAGVACPTCGTNLRADAKFCDECGAALSRTGEAAECKQVTVLFADVVHSMDIAAVVGSERLRELMSELFDRSDEAAYRDLRDRDRARAIELGFEGHIDMAAAMT